MNPAFPTVALRVSGASTASAFEYARAAPRILPRFISVIAKSLSSRANVEGRSPSSRWNLHMWVVRYPARLSSAPGRCADRRCPPCITTRTSRTKVACHCTDRRARKSKSVRFFRPSSNPPIPRAAFVRTRYVEVGAGTRHCSRSSHRSPVVTLRPPARRTPLGASTMVKPRIH